LSRINDENKGFKETNEKQPVKNIFFGIGFKNCGFFEQIFEQGIGSDQKHKEQHYKYQAHDDVDNVHKAEKIVEKADKKSEEDDNTAHNEIGLRNGPQKGSSKFLFGTVVNVKGQEKQQNEPNTGMIVRRHAT
jgi:hypothetical protein